MSGMLPSNALNNVRVERGVVVKSCTRTTSTSTATAGTGGGALEGELFFYREISRRVPRLQRLFPRLLSGSPARIELEFVPSAPLTRLFAALRMQPRHLEAAFIALDALHAVGEREVPLMLRAEAARRFLAEKTAARFSAPEFAGLRGAHDVLRLLLERLDAYEPRVVRVVHGDAWFANILLESDEGDEAADYEHANGGEMHGAVAAEASASASPPRALRLRFVDMRGRVGDELTLNGDALYDYAKLLQSLLGFDEAVFGLATVPPGYRASLLASFFGLVRARGAKPADVLTVALCLMAGSLPFHERRDGLWRLVCALVERLPARSSIEGRIDASS